MSEDKKTEGRRVDLPIRAKRGATGEERFQKIYGDSKQPTKWADPADPIPDDAECVVLNAFDVAFHKDVPKVLRESVAPTLALIEQCRELAKKGNLKKIVVVSTAYVQPPLPFNRCDAPITPFNGAADPWGTYKALLDGKIVWDDLVAHPDVNPHNTQNAYIYSKTLMEHLIASYTDIPQVYIVRPSVIGPTSDGERGSPATPGCASVRLMLSPLGRFVPSSGCECLGLSRASPTVTPIHPTAKTKSETFSCALQVRTTCSSTTWPAESCRPYRWSHRRANPSP